MTRATADPVSKGSRSFTGHSGRRNRNSLGVEDEELQSVRPEAQQVTRRGAQYGPVESRSQSRLRIPDRARVAPTSGTRAHPLGATETSPWADSLLHRKPPRALPRTGQRNHLAAPAVSDQAAPSPLDRPHAAGGATHAHDRAEPTACLARLPRLLTRSPGLPSLPWCQFGPRCRRICRCVTPPRLWRLSLPQLRPGSAWGLG